MFGDRHRRVECVLPASMILLLAIVSIEAHSNAVTHQGVPSLQGNCKSMSARVPDRFEGGSVDSIPITTKAAGKIRGRARRDRASRTLQREDRAGQRPEEFETVSSLQIRRGRGYVVGVDCGIGAEEGGILALPGDGRKAERQETPKQA